jgi:arylsulfatase A-like enzyme
MLYEGGVRVPFLVRWKGMIRAGSRCAEPIISVDMLPTFVELAGGSAPRNVDGVSLMSLLKSSGQAKLEPRALFWHFPGYLEGNAKTGAWRTTPAGSIRSGDYKLIEFFEDNRVELYNLREDPSQKSNLVPRVWRFPPPASTSDVYAKAALLHAQLHHWREQVKAPMPTAK